MADDPKSTRRRIRQPDTEYQVSEGAQIVTPQPQRQQRPQEDDTIIIRPRYPSDRVVRFDGMFVDEAQTIPQPIPQPSPPPLRPSPPPPPPKPLERIFKVGDMVQIRLDSQYTGQNIGVGKVERSSVAYSNSEHSYRVKWDRNNYLNSYRERDLMLAAPEEIKKLEEQLNVRKKELEAEPTTITVSVNVHNQFAECLKSLRLNEIRHPTAYLIGRNKDWVVCDAVVVKPDLGMGGCENMLSLETESLHLAYIAIAKKKLIPCGIARVGYAFIKGKTEGNRGLSLRQISLSSGFIISFGIDFIEVQRMKFYDGNGASDVKNMGYAITKMPKKWGHRWLKKQS